MLPALLGYNVGQVSQVEGPVSKRTALCEQPHEGHDGQNANAGSGSHAHEGEQRTKGIGQEECRYRRSQTQNDQTGDHLHLYHI